MEKIEIKDFVGIKDITIEIKQINIFIGLQASGKMNEQEIYVELKGSDVKHAVEQIATSIKQLTDNMQLLKLCFIAFIASTRCPINSTEVQNIKKKFKKQYQAKLIIKNGAIIHKV